jgi:hypothetical protein
MQLELQVADIVHAQKMKKIKEKMPLKRKHVCNMVILVAIAHLNLGSSSICKHVMLFYDVNMYVNFK